MSLHPQVAALPNEKAGVEVSYREFSDMVHGFVLFGGALDAANAAVAECGERLRSAFEKVTA